MIKTYGKTQINVKEAAKLSKDDFFKAFAGVLKTDVGQVYEEIQKLGGNKKKVSKPKAKPKPTKKDSKKEPEGEF